MLYNGDDPDLVHIRPLSYFAVLPTCTKELTLCFRIGGGVFQPLRVTDSVVVFKFHHQLY